MAPHVKVRFSLPLKCAVDAVPPHTRSWDRPPPCDQATPSPASSAGLLHRRNRVIGTESQSPEPPGRSPGLSIRKLASQRVAGLCRVAPGCPECVLRAPEGQALPGPLRPALCTVVLSAGARGPGRACPPRHSVHGVRGRTRLAPPGLRCAHGRRLVWGRRGEEADCLLEGPDVASVRGPAWSRVTSPCPPRELAKPAHVLPSRTAGAARWRAPWPPLRCDGGRVPQQLHE